MREYQIDLSSIPRDYLSKEEFYKVAHIRKATALWLLETGLVTAEKPERKGFGYKIPKAAVEHYYCRDKSKGRCWKNNYHRKPRRRTGGSRKKGPRNRR